MRRKKILLLRDDDVNFFTTPTELQEVYGGLFNAGIPINFSVIPAVNAAATTESDDFGKGTYEPFLPPHTAGTNQEFPISKNLGLKSFFESVNWKYDILMHGYNHSSSSGHYEFDCDDESVLKSKILNGLDILNKAFGVRPIVFVAPQDQYSSTALKCLKHEFKGFSLGWIDRRKLSLFRLPQYAYMKLRHRNYLNDGGFMILEHSGCIFSKFRNPAQEIMRLDAYIETHDLVVIVVHHWEFYRNGILDTDRHSLFQKKIFSLATQHSFVTFREIAIP